MSVGKLKLDEGQGRGGGEVAGHSEGCRGVAGCLSEEVGKVNWFPKVKFRILKFFTQLLTKKKSVGKLQFIMKKIQVKVGERELVMMKVKESLGKLERCNILSAHESKTSNNGADTSEILPKINS